MLLTACKNPVLGETVSYVGVCETEFNDRRLYAFFTINNLNYKGLTTCHVSLKDKNGEAFVPDGTQVEARLFASDESWRPNYWRDASGGLLNSRAPRVSVVVHSPYKNPTLQKEGNEED